MTLAYVDVCGGDPEEWERRWRGDERGGRRPRRRRRGHATPVYRGLARYEPDDAALFFGRDRLVGRLTELTRRHRFTAVFDPPAAASPPCCGPV
ncbi:hypothetical protein LV779_11240 [Streptomyces thinghirensis]|nr:hypothetical protein [Streptomyces thinghirensis]